MKKRDRKYIVLAAVFILVGIATNFFMGQSESRYVAALAAQQEELRSLENTLEVKKVNRVAENNGVLSMVTGLDMDRKVADDEVFGTFMKKVTTWSGMDGYDQMRASVSQENFLTDTFRKIFLVRPEAGASGTEEPSCRFDSMSSKVVSINGDTYTYFTEVKVLASGGSGARSSMFVCVYNTDSTHALTRVAAYTLVR